MVLGRQRQRHIADIEAEARPDNAIVNPGLELFDNPVKKPWLSDHFCTNHGSIAFPFQEEIRPYSSARSRVMTLIL